MPSLNSKQSLQQLTYSLISIRSITPRENRITLWVVEPRLRPQRLGQEGRVGCKSRGCVAPYHTDSPSRVQAEDSRLVVVGGEHLEKRAALILSPWFP